MENTLEVRWFVRGMPPAVVQRWFKLECLGKFKQPEVRQDWYAYQNSSNLGLVSFYFPYQVVMQSILNCVKIIWN